MPLITRLSAIGSSTKHLKFEVNINVKLSQSNQVSVIISVVLLPFTQHRLLNLGLSLHLLGCLHLLAGHWLTRLLALHELLLHLLLGVEHFEPLALAAALRLLGSLLE